MLVCVQPSIKMQMCIGLQCRHLQHQWIWGVLYVPGAYVRIRCDPADVFLVSFCRAVTALFSLQSDTVRLRSAVSVHCGVLRMSVHSRPDIVRELGCLEDGTAINPVSFLVCSISRVFSRPLLPNTVLLSISKLCVLFILPMAAVASGRDG